MPPTPVKRIHVDTPCTSRWNDFCQQQGRTTSKGNSGLVECKAGNPSQICKRFKRFQAQARFPPTTKKKQEAEPKCLVCQGSHAVCCRCWQLVDVSQEGKEAKHKLRHELASKICAACAKDGYSPCDLNTYSCRGPNCNTSGGARLFDPQSLNNFKKGQTQPTCVKCRAKKQKTK